MAKKNKGKWFIAILFVLAVAISIFATQFTVFSPDDSEEVRKDVYLYSTPHTSSFKFHDYNFRITGENEAHIPQNCEKRYDDDIEKQTMQQDRCNVREVGQAYGCTYKTANKVTRLYCPDGIAFNKGGTSVIWCSNGEAPEKECDESELIDYKVFPKPTDFSGNTPGHFFKGKLFYKGEKIYQTGGFTKNGYREEDIDWYLSEDGKRVNRDSKDRVFRLSWGGRATEGDGDRYSTGYVEMDIHSSNFEAEQILPEDVVQENDTYIDIKIQNKLNMEFSGKLITDYSVNTTIGAAEKTTTQNVQVEPGQNTYQVRIPTKQPNTVDINPQLKLFVDASDWSGFVYREVNDDYREVTNKGDVLAGKFNFDKQRVTVISYKVFELEENLESQEAKLQRLKEQQEANAQQIQDMEDNLDAQAEEIETLTRTNEEKAALIANLQGNITRQEQLIDKLSDSQQEKQQMLVTLMTLLDEEESNIQELMQELEGSDEEISNILSAYEDELVKQSKYSSQLNVSNHEMNEVIGKYLQNLITQKEAVQELKVKNEDFKRLVSEYRDRLDKMQTTVESLKQKNEKLGKLLEKQIQDKGYYKQQLQISYWVIGGLAAVIIILIIILIRVSKK